MPALNFMRRFADAVESGEKRQTIRAYRKDGRDPKPGDTLYLFTGQRTKRCRRLGMAKCKSVEPICLRYSHLSASSIKLNGQWRGLRTLHRVAWADGFNGGNGLLHTVYEMHGLPFEGLLIRW